MATQRLCFLLVLSFAMAGAVAAPVGTAFTYQGELKVSGAPANADFDFDFALFTVAAAGTQLAAVLRDDTPVVNGLFTVELDFTDVPFAASQEYFLEVRVRNGASTGGYQQLLPRQKITAAPYALNARTVQAGAVSQLAIAAGAVGSAQLQPGAVTNTLINNLAVTDAKIANATITGAKLVDATITGVKIADAAITDAKISDATITAAKFAFTPGDITNVIAGTGLTGGAATGAATLTVNTATIQARVTGTCPIGEYFRGIAANGTVVCEPVPGVTRRTVPDSGGEFTSIAIGTDGLPVVSYYDSAFPGELMVAKCANSACTGAATTSTIDDSTANVGKHSSIAIGTDGFPVISYQDFSNKALKVAKCLNAACTGTVTVNVVEDTGADLGEFSSIAIGTDGRPVISYHDGTGGALKVAKCTNASCIPPYTITIVDTLNNVGEYTSIAIGAGGFPVISYYDGTAFALKVAKCVALDCTGAATIFTVDDPANQVGRHTSIAVFNGGLPIISYWDNSANALKVASCTLTNCSGAVTITTVDNPANVVGEYTSLAIGSDGTPVISYHDFSAGSLKVAKCNNKACTGLATITTLDDPGNGIVGRYSSIAIGNDGLPVISYWDTPGNDLKVAKCGTQSCQ